MHIRMIDERNVFAKNLLLSMVGVSIRIHTLRPYFRVTMRRVNNIVRDNYVRFIIVEEVVIKNMQFIVTGTKIDFQILVH